MGSHQVPGGSLFSSASFFPVANPRFFGGEIKIDVSRVARGVTLKDLMTFFRKKMRAKFKFGSFRCHHKSFSGRAPLPNTTIPPPLPRFYQGFDWGRGTPESSTISPNSYYMSMSLGTLRITGDNTPQWKGE